MKSRLEIRFPLHQQREFWFGKPYEPQSNEFLLNHARSGIMLALQALNLPAGSSVGVMAYNCHTVFNAITQAGYTPVFLDITESLTLDLDDLRRKRYSLQALVVTHLFGILNNIAAIRKEYPDLPIIEDCAHAFGIQESNGDFAVFSVGQGKFPSLGDGGILKVVNNKYLGVATQLFGDLPEYSWTQYTAQWSRMVLKSWLYSPCLYSCVTKPIKDKRKVSSGVDSIFPRKMSKGIRAMYDAFMLGVTDAIKQRRYNTQTVNRQLAIVPGISKVLSGSINGFFSVALCDNLSLAKKTLREKGIEAETHFASCIDWAKSFGYKEGSCPQTEQLTHCLLMVPTYK